MQSERNADVGAWEIGRMERSENITVLPPMLPSIAWCRHNNGQELHFRQLCKRKYWSVSKCSKFDCCNSNSIVRNKNGFKMYRCLKKLPENQKTARNFRTICPTMLTEHTKSSRWPFSSHFLFVLSSFTIFRCSFYQHFMFNFSLAVALFAKCLHFWHFKCHS